MAFQFFFYCKTPITNISSISPPQYRNRRPPGILLYYNVQDVQRPRMGLAFLCRHIYRWSVFCGYNVSEPRLSRSPPVTLVRGPFTRHHIPALLSIDCYQIPAGRSSSACSRLLLSPSAESQDHAAPIAHRGGKGKNRCGYIQSDPAVIQMENGRIFILH